MGEIMEIVETMSESVKPVRVALTIAGSDSSGGAGVQADLLAFNATGVHGASVITCVTAQNSKGVQKIEPLSLDIISAQLASVLEDLRPMVIKTGMLYSSEIVKLVAEKIGNYRKNLTQDRQIILIVDPVLVATSGSNLTETESKYDLFIETLKSELFPKATLITPNLPEASALLGWEVKTLEDMRTACKELKEFGSLYVLLKGGHRVQVIGAKTAETAENVKFKGKAIDILYGDGDNYRIYTAEYHNKSVHGTGCSFASAISGYLARGLTLEVAVEMAKDLVTSGIIHSSSIGDGIDCINITEKDLQNDQQFKIIVSVTRSTNRLLEILKPDLIPEVGINIGYAKENAQALSDICALTGRIVRVGNRAGCMGLAEFGASKHVGRIILAAMKHDDEKRCAMNIKYRQEILETCKHLDYSLGSFSRKNEPKDASSMEWGTCVAIEQLGYVPDIIYDTGGIGKEPMIRVLGRNPDEVINKVEQIINIIS
jgi:hydroxymethylpyrimidine/phosphomethylpyrimidine kinase